MDEVAHFGTMGDAFWRHPWRMSATAAMRPPVNAPNSAAERHVQGAERIQQAQKSLNFGRDV
jgi:hypothetical protein